MPTSPRPTLLFDYGGTLDSDARHWNYVLRDGFAQAARTHPALSTLDTATWRAAYVLGERTLAQQPIIQPEDDFLTLLQKKVTLEVDHLCTEGGFPFSPTERASIVDIVAHYCDDQARQCVARSREVLDTLLQRGYSLVLVTNFYGNIRAVLRAYGLLDHFPLIVESATAEVRKPDAAIWQLGCDLAQRAPHDCIAIGDAFGKDIAPAHSLGCKTIWFRGEEWTPKSVDETIPTHIIYSLSDLLKLLP